MKFYTNVTQKRNKIIHSYYKDGQKFYEEQDFCPSLFIRSNKKSSYKDLFDNNVEQINFGGLKEFKEYKKQNKDIFNFYGDIEPKYQFISDYYQNEIEFNPKDIRIFLYDIEVVNIYDHQGLDTFPKPEKAAVPIVSISVKDLKDNIMYVFSLVDYDKNKINIEIDVKKIRFKKFETEKDLLIGFISLMKICRPDILCGWYNKGFDDPYILHRMDQLLPKHVWKQISPCNSVSYNFTKNKQGKIVSHVNIEGLQILDYIELYKKFIPGGRESFSLGFISQYELGDDKVSYEEFDNLKDLYLKSPQKATDYNIKDVELIHQIDKKLKLFDLILVMAYMAKVNFEDVLSPVRTWDSKVYNYLKEKMIVIPPNKIEDKEDYAGAYVFEPTPGVYDWVVSYDLNSLYPHLIMQFNISPETLVDLEEDVDQEEIDERILNKKIKVNKKYMLSGSGQYFRKDKKGFAPYLMEKYYTTRKKVKQSMIKDKQEYEKNPSEELKNQIAAKQNKQLALKIFLNSFYGSYANRYFRFYDIRLAKAITLSGQLAIKWVSKYLDEFLLNKFKQKNKEVAGDTDSIYYTLDFVVKGIKEKNNEKIVNYVDKFNSKIVEPKIEQIYKNLAEYLNVNENKMVMKREKILEKFLAAGKKKYAYMIWDDEGVRYKKPKFKVTGLEIVRSSTPNVVKPYLKEAVKKLMYSINSEDLQSYIQQVKEEFLTKKPEEIAFPRGVSDVTKYIDKAKMYRKGTPIGPRASIIYNNYIDKYNIQMPLISDGAKIKFFYLLQPNTAFNENVFAYLNNIPNRTEIIKYVDYNLQFEKTFFNVVKQIAAKAGINIEQKIQIDLENLF